MIQIRCVIMRGGTSKGIYLHEKDLPKESDNRKKWILSLFGSPDPRQIDGLGGADPLTSRVAIISPSKRKDADVEYTFGLVHIREPIVDFQGTCGNLLSGVGPFAIDEGLVAIQEPETVVRIFDTNTKQLIHATVPVIGRKAAVLGLERIPGVPHPGAPIRLNFLNCAGSSTGKLLPTGKAVEKLNDYTVSIVDAANVVVFVLAKEIGLSGDETAAQIDADTNLLVRMEELRNAAGTLLKIPSSGVIPKIAIVSPSHSNDSDVTARMLALGKTHKAYAVSVGLCTAIAAHIPETVVQQCCNEPQLTFRIAHPSGIMEVRAKVERGKIIEASIIRTARRLMDGHAYLPFFA